MEKPSSYTDIIQAFRRGEVTPAEHEVLLYACVAEVLCSAQFELGMTINRWKVFVNEAGFKGFKSSIVLPNKEVRVEVLQIEEGKLSITVFQFGTERAHLSLKDLQHILASHSSVTF